MNYKDDIKAIVFDYDGTLIDFNYKASEYTIKALQLLKDKPYKICLSSGRPCFLGLKAFKDTFGDYPLDYVFGCNGSEFKDIKNNRDELLYKISGEDIRYLYSLLNKEYLVCCVYEGEDILVDKLTDNDEINDWYKARWLKPIKYDISKNISDRSKIMTLNAKADRLIQDEYIKSIADKLSNFTYAYSTSNCFEIVPKGVSKAKCIEKLCEILSCKPEQILSFGDMANDMPMLLNSSGVIMDNASDDLKAKVKLHTSRVDEMGVYEFLAKNQLI